MTKLSNCNFMKKLNIIKHSKNSSKYKKFNHYNRLFNLVLPNPIIRAKHNQIIKFLFVKILPIVKYSILLQGRETTGPMEFLLLNS